MKHYFIHAAIQGILVGVACIFVFGPVIGLAVAFIMGVWGVKSARDMVSADKRSRSFNKCKHESSGHLCGDSYHDLFQCLKCGSIGVYDFTKTPHRMTWIDRNTGEQEEV
jgi:hypothetical protein